MRLGDVFEYVNYATNKDALGEPLSAEKFNLIIQIASDNYYRDRYKEILELLSAQGISIGVKMFNDSPLFRFLSVKSYAFGNIVPELAPLPYDLAHTLGATMNHNNIWRTGELLDIESFNNRRYNIMAPSVKRKPIFIEKTGGYQFVPKNTRKARVDYLRKVKSPLFDYCIGLDDDEIYFMEVGSCIKVQRAAISNIDDPNNPTRDNGSPLTEDVNSLYDPNGVLVVSNVEHLTYTGTLPYFSKTIELDWDEDDITKIADSVIATASIKSREFNVAQAAAKSSTE